MSKTTISPSSSKPFWTAKTHLLVSFSHEHRKKSTEHFIICVVSDRVYSLCHYRFNDLFINPVRGWIYFNKYTVAWQFCIWPRWIFHNIKQSGGEAEEGGVRITRSHREWRFRESLTHTNKRTSTADTSNRAFKETVHGLFIVVYELPLCPWFSLRPSCHLDTASALIIFRIFSFSFQSSRFISLFVLPLTLYDSSSHTQSPTLHYIKKRRKGDDFKQKPPSSGFSSLIRCSPACFMLASSCFLSFSLNVSLPCHHMRPSALSHPLMCIQQLSPRWVLPLSQSHLPD